MKTTKERERENKKDRQADRQKDTHTYIETEKKGR